MAKTKQTEAQHRAEERRQYQRLEQRLIVVAWLNRKFGFKQNSDLLAFFKEAGEGFNEEGRGFVTTLLMGRGEKCQVPLPDLGRYDDNIRSHLAHINRRRSRPIVLKYFQHLALLYTEIFLDYYHHKRATLLAELNAFVDYRNIEKNPGELPDSRFSEFELSTLAFWMATGSGKTLLFHINYLQFRQYAKETGRSPDNILLITPNENLSAQHLEEMAESDIPCARFSTESSGLAESHPGTIKVLEITKLVSEKKGSGVSVPVEAFEGNNLIFVDEGHKGAGTEAQTWREIRKALAANGFTFEYSATFGQALDAARNDEVTDSYAKSIIFDYSYKYFYGDGYGKDFHILNLKDYEGEESVHILLLANLLSFYEQRAFFHAKEGELKEYLLDPPLWLQICRRVSATEAEVVQMLKFLARFVINQRGWAVKTIGKILKGSSGIQTVDGQDLFAGQLPWLRAGKRAFDAEKIYHDILSRVFQAAVPGNLEIKAIKAATGEVALRVSGSETYFGLLNIGNVSGFKTNLEKEAPELAVGEDAVSDPIFPDVKKASSKINLLIGAKKFMEGWSSWRVSNIGLLNVGVSEGSEIIQLFGRGVRLKGKNFSLKRSSAVPGIDPPDHLKLLETLNIFAVRANYMANFRDYLEREGIDTGGYVEMELPLWHNGKFLKEELYRPRLAKGKSFTDECEVILELIPAAKVRLDVTTRVTIIDYGGGAGLQQTQAMAGEAKQIPRSSLEFLDWRRIHLELIDYKQSRGYRNLTIPHQQLRAFFTAHDPVLYDLAAPQEWVEPKSLDDLNHLKSIVLSLLRKYVDRFYQGARQKWESDHMEYSPLTVDDDNFQDYKISVPKSDPDLVRTIFKIVKAAKSVSQKSAPKKIYAGEHAVDLPNLHFDRHLYQPLLIARKGENATVKTSPPGLNEGEKKFIEDLRDYWKKEVKGALKGKELYLLRNLGRGKGIGFFESKGFYPDFILWIKERGSQRILFVEPHGMMLEQGHIHSEKVALHRKLREHSESALKKSTLKNLQVDACVVSVTPFDELSKRAIKDDGSSYTRAEFTENRVLFQERREGYDYVALLFV